MNDHVDMSEFTIVGFRHLGGAQRVRALDVMHEMIGPCAPIPHFIDLKDEADLWAASLDQATLKIFLKANFEALTPEHQRAAAKYMTEFLAKQEAGKAEPRSG